jgi:hypothetical protein
MKTYNSDGQPTPGYDLSKLRLKKPGDGHNDSLITAAIAAYKMGAPKEATVGRLRELYEPSRPDYETAPQRAVDRAWEANGDISKLVDGKPRGKASGPSKVTLGKFDPTKLERFERMTMTELLAKSPGDVKTEPLEIIKALFSEKDLVCAETADQKYEGHAIWEVGKLQEEIKKSKFEIDDFKFLNPSTFLEKAGITQKGKSYLSKRCNDNVAQRCYMLLECDVKEGGSREGGKGFYTKEEALAIRERFITFCMELAKYLPLVMAVDSGGKSIHFWFWCGEWTEEVERVFAIACAHGADKAMRVLSQKARMPNVSGYDDRRDQKLLYYDPERIGGEWDVDCFMKEFAPSIRIHRTEKGFYFMENKVTGNWESVTIAEARQTLDLEGKANTRGKGANKIFTNEIKKIVEAARHEGSVCGCLQLAGRSRGLFRLPSGDQLLIPKVKREIIPVAGDCLVTLTLLRNMFPYEEGAEFQQYDVLMGWAAWAKKSYRDETITSGQFLHIAGDAGSYKTMLINGVMAPQFGGSVAKLNDHLRKQQDFNNDLFTSFLLVGDDPPAPGRGEILDPNFFKAIAVTSHHASCHAKQLDRVTVPALRRGVLLTNTAKAALEVIPAFDHGVNDKFICLHAMQSHLKVEGYHFENEDDIVEALKNEAAAFAYLLENWDHNFQSSDKETNKAITRYSVPSFKHPLVLAALREATGTQSSMDAIFRVVWMDDFENDEMETKCFKAAELQALGKAADNTGEADFWGWKTPRSLGKSLAEIDSTSDLLRSTGSGSNIKIWHFSKPTPEDWKAMFFGAPSRIFTSEEDLNF